MTVCSRCIYDSTIPYIRFDDEGVCNYCRQVETLDRDYPTGSAGEAIIQSMVERIRAEGRGKPYDVVVGVSGGCDSSYMLYKAVQWGLRPLAVHYDNTWNSQTAVENIHNVLANLKVDLYTHVVNNEEYNDIFRAFLLASVPDIDTASDIGLAATHYLAAQKYGIRTIFEGHSFRTEGLSPHGWFYIDGKYVESVHDLYGTRKRATFPNLTLGRFLYWTAVRRIRKIRPLYYLDYDKEAAKELLTKELGWKWYGGHHMENRTAYFTNNYYLPVKFQIDLRYTEFSALVRAGQMSRATALEEIRKPKPYGQDLLDEVKKRLGFSHEEFERIMALPRRTYREFRTYKHTFERMRGLFWVMARLDLVPMSFYLKYTRRYEDD
jgi:N-acetyl sugar amidotransferase